MTLTQVVDLLRAILRARGEDDDFAISAGVAGYYSADASCVNPSVAVAETGGRYTAGGETIEAAVAALFLIVTDGKPNR
jgi:hypothetical protein